MRLLPIPRTITEKEGLYRVDYRNSIMIGAECGANVFLYGQMLKETIAASAGVEMAVCKGTAAKGDILLTVSEENKTAEGKACYTLTVSPEGIRVTGADEELLLNGVQTLRQIVRQTGGLVPCLVIEDYPDIPNRGFYHDVSRGRIPTLNQMKQLVDMMCEYKMNQLQLYVEHTYLFRGLSEMWRADTPLTAEEILELDDYCAARHIDLVPSMASFGHLYHLLNTYTCRDLCEYENTPLTPFSFWQRMDHHTVNVSNPDSIALIKEMISEYMSLFRSRYFNLCADETFDLCKGKSRHLTEAQKVDDIYVKYVRELSEYLIEKGKIPMFWGDIICHFPEKMKDIPRENICLNWGYAPEQREYETEVFENAGATQYTCPGVAGWNEWMNLFHNSYENIRRMCTYAMRHHAIGVLNTDWGDFGHVNQPEFSYPGLIYGAAFSWNAEIVPYEEINAAVSRLLYGDEKEQVMAELSRVAEHQSFPWHDVVKFHDCPLIGRSEEERRNVFYTKPLDEVEKNVAVLTEVRDRVQDAFAGCNEHARGMLQKYLIAIDAMIVWNRVKPHVAAAFYGEAKPESDPRETAAQLERWFMHYKAEWRKVSKEGDLRYISEIVFWYADLLRNMK